MRYLGLDLGTTTLGISITDKTNTLVSPLKVIKFSFEVVLGLPKNMDGSMGFASKRSLDFKELLEKNNISVILEDERLTTKESENIIHSNNENIKNTKNKIDAIAACLILESYLKKVNK